MHSPVDPVGHYAYSGRVSERRGDDWRVSARQWDDWQCAPCTLCSFTLSVSTLVQGVCTDSTDIHIGLLRTLIRTRLTLAANINY